MNYDEIKSLKINTVSLFFFASPFVEELKFQN